jgi:HEAT repeat protein
VLQTVVEKFPDSTTHALSELGDQAIPTVIQILRHSKPLVRMRMCEALKSPLRFKRLDPQPFIEMIPEFLVLLHDNWHMLRWRAASLLGDLHAAPDQCIPALMRCLEDSFPEVQGAAALALGEYGDLASIAIPQLIELSNAKDVPLRCFVLSALGQFSDARVLPILIEALKDRAVATSAIYSLGRRKWPAEVVVPVLCDCIKHGDSILTWAATNIIGDYGNAARAAIPALRAAMANAFPDLREQMVNALAKIE